MVAPLRRLAALTARPRAVRAAPGPRSGHSRRGKTSASRSINAEPPRASFVPFDSAAPPCGPGSGTRPGCSRSAGTWKFMWVERSLPTRRRTSTSDGFDAQRVDRLPGAGELGDEGLRHARSSSTRPSRSRRIRRHRRTCRATGIPSARTGGRSACPRTGAGARCSSTSPASTRRSRSGSTARPSATARTARRPPSSTSRALLRRGDNTVAVQVYAFSVGSYLESQDMWRLAGIERDVWLVSRPASHIRDFFVHGRSRCVLHRRRAAGDGGRPANRSGHRAGHTVVARVVRRGRQGHARAASPRRCPAGAGADGDARFEHAVTAPSRWTAETPALYALALTLRDASGRVGRDGRRARRVPDGGDPRRPAARQRRAHLHQGREPPRVRSASAATW